MSDLLNVNEYHDSLSNAKLVQTLSHQLEHLRSDLSAMKTSGQKLQFCRQKGLQGALLVRPRGGTAAAAAGGEGGFFRRQHSSSSEPQVVQQEMMNFGFTTIPPANNGIPPPPANGFVRTSRNNNGFDTSSTSAEEAPPAPTTPSSSSSSHSSLTPAAADTDFRAELRAVSAELQKVAQENEALQKIHWQHAAREQDLQMQVGAQLEAYGQAERELEQVKAQSLKQLEQTNQEAADRLAQETAEFKDRLRQAEHMVRRMAEILLEAEDKLDQKLSSTTRDDFVAQGVNQPRRRRRTRGGGDTTSSSRSSRRRTMVWLLERRPE